MVSPGVAGFAGLTSVKSLCSMAPYFGLLRLRKSPGEEGRTFRTTGAAVCPLLMMEIVAVASVVV